MSPHELDYGKPNPNASPGLSRFAFLIADWRCDAKLKQDDGTWGDLKATWEGRCILNGFAIGDEFRLMSLAGELLVLGMNFRVYDSKKTAWNMKWLNVLAGTWTDLEPEALGGVKADGKSISYVMKEPVARHAFTRATYVNNSSDDFTWRGEKSNDGKTWQEFIAIEAYCHNK